MLIKMKLNSAPFEKIKSGAKDIELRLYDEKRRGISLFDVISFTSDSGEEIRALVTGLHVAKSFDELYSIFDKVRLGYEPWEPSDPEDMEKYYTKEDIIKYGVLGIEIAVQGSINPAILVDAGICPTCFDKEYGGLIYGDNSDKLICKDDLIECFLVGNPRCPGHAAISSIEHFKDMTEITDQLCAHAFRVASELMRRIKATYGAESIYLCTMCDGPMNHFHLQLIPRYSEERRGSSNFLKPRGKYVLDLQKLEKLRLSMKKYLNQ